MSDFDSWIIDVLDEAIRPSGSLHKMVRKIYSEAYDHATAPKGLPGVTEEQVGLAITRINDDPDCMGLAEGLTQWFNDPNRGAPVKPTMHPDLKYLAQLWPESIEDGARGLGDNPLFFKPVSRSSFLSVVRDHDRVPPGKQAFTLPEIEQARKRLAQKRLVASARQTQNSAVMTATEQRVKELEAERDAYLRSDDEEHGPSLDDIAAAKDALEARDRLSHDLNNLPDYETWFETHGSERTVKFNVHPLAEATVHELYTMFRARLLDELRQAGVIGDDHV